MQTDIQMVRLRWLIAINVLATVPHYIDNALFFPEYPEPLWGTPQIVAAFWFLMPPVAVLGYTLFARGHVRSGSLVLYAYSAMSLLALGHYLVAPIYRVGLRINLFILLEAFSALSLVVYVAYIQLWTRSVRPYERS